MPPIQTKYDLQPRTCLRPERHSPHRHTVSSNFTLEDRIAHLRWVESELARCQNQGGLQIALVKKAHEVFKEFGKTVTFAVMFNQTTVVIHTPDPANPKNIGIYCANYLPENLPHGEILSRAEREQAIIHKQEGNDEFLALPFAIKGTQIIWGLMLLSNQTSQKAFTPDDIEIARLFTQIATNALTDYKHRQALS